MATSYTKNSLITSLTDDQIILLIKDCYQQLKDKQVILIK
jgi:hypothetical protein